MKLIWYKRKKRKPMLSLMPGIFCLLFSLFLTGCAPQPDPSQNFNATNLSDLESLTASNTPAQNATGISHIRLQAIQETALSFGAQGGLAWQAKHINNMLTKNTPKLDQVFNFRGLLLNHNVLPPVLEQGNQLLNLANPETIRIADKTYKIISQARFVTAPPNWREYIWMNYKTPTIPNKTLLPCNDGEREIWIKYIRKGWNNGIKQAETIYADNLARLKRDYNGMILYRELLAKNMISKPYVASSNLGVTSNQQDTQMYINDQVLRITALPKLNPRSRTWKPLISQD